MIASVLIEKAAVRAALAVPGAVPALVAGIGLDALNRWYRLLWMSGVHRDTVVTRLAVAVPAGDGVVEIPTAIDGVRAVDGPCGPILPLGDVSESDFAAFWSGPGMPVRYVALADSVDGESKPVSVIRLVPPPTQAVTIQVSGVKRFAALTAADAPLLCRYEDALFYYVLSEFYQYAGDEDGRKAALADAKAHRSAADDFETKVVATDEVNVPLESMAHG